MNSATPHYDAMCAAIDACHAMPDDVFSKLSLDECCQIASNVDAERMAAQIRLRAERRLGILMRDEAGLKPKNKADAAWLAEWHAAAWFDGEIAAVQGKRP